jgi:probable rRNA maturation factor
MYDELDMEINVLIDLEYKGKFTKRWLTAIACRVLKAEKTGENVELGILITGQANISELNKTYRGKDGPTDVLSFYMNPEIPQDIPDVYVTPPDNIKHLGEVIISYPQALIQAREQKYPVKEEITLLLVHGVLHLVGYDHEKSPAEDKRMRAREIDILKQITGCHNSYLKSLTIKP